MSRGVMRRDNLTKDTLVKIAKIAGIGAVVTIAATSPYFLHQLARKFFKDSLEKVVRARARKLRELERRKLINFKHLKNGELRIELSQQGKVLIRQYNLDQMKLEKSKQWDKKWRVIIYDIPQYKKKASDAFREKLRALGLFQLQKSVWVSAYNCLSELEFLCSVFEIDMDKCVYYFSTEEIPKQEIIKEFFGL